MWDTCKYAISGQRGQCPQSLVSALGYELVSTGVKIGCG